MWTLIAQDRRTTEGVSDWEVLRSADEDEVERVGDARRRLNALVENSPYADLVDAQERLADATDEARSLVLGSEPGALRRFRAALDDWFRAFFAFGHVCSGFGSIQRYDNMFGGRSKRVLAEVFGRRAVPYDAFSEALVAETRTSFAFAFARLLRGVSQHGSRDFYTLRTRQEEGQEPALTAAVNLQRCRELSDELRQFSMEPPPGIDPGRIALSWLTTEAFVASTRVWDAAILASAEQASQWAEEVLRVRPWDGTDRRALGFANWDIASGREHSSVTLHDIGEDDALAYLRFLEGARARRPEPI